MANHNDTGHVPTTFPLDPNLTELPLNTSLRMLDKIARLADAGETISGQSRNQQPCEKLWGLFASIVDNAEMLRNLLNHYHKVRSKPDGCGSFVTTPQSSKSMN